jgi:hypothetical protein
VGKEGVSGEACERELRWLFTRRTDQTFRTFCVGDTQVPARDYLSTNHQIVPQCDMLAAEPKTREEEGRERDLGDEFGMQG